MYLNFEMVSEKNQTVDFLDTLQINSNLFKNKECCYCSFFFSEPPPQKKEKKEIDLLKELTMALDLKTNEH